MDSQIKRALKHGFASGFIYAVGIAAFELFDGTRFNLGYFIFNFVFFGLCMSLGISYEKKMSDKNEK